jgi:hypothetical protein
MAQEEVECQFTELGSTKRVRRIVFESKACQACWCGSFSVVTGTERVRRARGTAQVLRWTVQHSELPLCSMEYTVRTLFSREYVRKDLLDLSGMRVSQANRCRMMRTVYEPCYCVPEVKSSSGRQIAL